MVVRRKWMSYFHCISGRFLFSFRVTGSMEGVCWRKLGLWNHKTKGKSDDVAVIIRKIAVLIAFSIKPNNRSHYTAVLSTENKETMDDSAYAQANVPHFNLRLTNVNKTINLRQSSDQDAFSCLYCLKREKFFSW